MNMLDQLMGGLRAMTEAEAMAFAERAGVPWGTVMKIKYGQTKNPGVLTVQKLIDQMQADRHRA